jgi:hypothetical protein
MGRVITGALLNNKSKKFLRGIWLFPAICTVVLILLTFFKVSGSSIGAYYPAFYGSQKDPALLLNKFRGVRSDEWVVRTPIQGLEYSIQADRLALFRAWL